MTATKLAAALVALLALASPARAATLVGHWRLDETSGTAAADTAGTRPGTVETGATEPGWSAARPPSLGAGGSLDLDGVDDVVRVVSLGGALGPFDFRSTDDFSIAFWAFTDDNSEPSSGGFNHRAWHIQNGAGEALQLIVRETGKTVFGFGASGVSADPATVFPVGVWSHVVTVKSGATLRIYRNGVDVTGASQAGGDPQAGGTSFTIGNVRHQSGSPSGPFDGKIDDFRVYAGALTAAEVGALYASRTIAGPPVTGGLKLWLDAADETSLRLSGSGVSEWRDRSGAGVHVTQASAAAQPLLVPSAINGRPAIRFDGGDSLASASTAALSFTEATIFLVRNAASGPLGTPLAIGIAGTSNDELLFFNGLHNGDWNPVFHHTSPSNYKDLGNTLRPAGHFVQAGVFGTTTGDLQNFVNGVASTLTATVVGTPAGYTAVSRAAYLGVRGDGGTFYTGDIAEVLVYDRKLSAGELSQVGVYLEKKYALPTAYDGGGVSRWSEAVSGLGPVGWWRLNESSGSTAFDAAQPAQNGAHAGTVGLGAAPAFDATTTNRAYALSGDDYVEMGDVLDAGTGSLTFAAWFRMSSAPATGSWKILNKGLTSAGTPLEAGFGIRVNPDQFGVQVAGPSEGFTSAFVGLPSFDQWHFVAGVLDRAAGQLRLYLDPADGGATASVAAGSVGSLDTNIPLAIGALHRGAAGDTSEFFVGSVDEVVIFQKALTGAEVQRLYDAALTTAVPGTFFGEDFNPTDAGSGATARPASRPNADAGRAAFLAGAGQLATGTEGFEGFSIAANGSANVASFDIAFGALPVTATVVRIPTPTADADFRLENLASGLRFGTYPISGAQYLATSNIEHEVRFSSGVNAFGFYATDVEVATLLLDVYSGAALVTSTAVRSAPPNAADGSVLYFGLLSDESFDRVVFRKAGASDGFAYDDFTAGVADLRLFMGGSGLSWTNGANWNPVGPPSITDHVRIPPGVGPIAITASATARTLTLPPGFASSVSVQAPLTIAEGLVITSGTLEVGAPGSVTVSGSVIVNGGTLKGSIAGSGGAVTLSAGGTLKGNAAVGRPVIVGPGGRISPGE